MPLLWHGRKHVIHTKILSNTAAQCTDHTVPRLRYDQIPPSPLHCQALLPMGAIITSKHQPSVRPAGRLPSCRAPGAAHYPTQHEVGNIMAHSPRLSIQNSTQGYTLKAQTYLLALPTLHRPSWLAAPPVDIPNVMGVNWAAQRHDLTHSHAACSLPLVSLGVHTDAIIVMWQRQHIPHDVCFKAHSPANEPADINPASPTARHDEHSLSTT
jgi:hypothetical protein